jgi:hypothetical protein
MLRPEMNGPVIGFADKTQVRKHRFISKMKRKLSEMILVFLRKIEAFDQR